VKVLRGHDRTVAQWVEARMDGRCVFPHAALGIIDDNGVLRGGFVLAFHTPTTADLTLYAPLALTHGVMRGFFRWCFLECGVRRLQIATTRSNKTIKRGAPKMGFKFDGVAKDYYDVGVDALRYAMMADDCRWIRAHGITFQTAEAARAA